MLNKDTPSDVSTDKGFLAGKDMTASDVKDENGDFENFDPIWNLILFGK